MTTNGFTKLYHDLSEAIMMRDFTKHQRKILDLILRLSEGCGKNTALIPLQKNFEVVGVYECDIRKEINWLVESKIISIEGTDYQINPDVKAWQVSRVKPFYPEKLSELLKLNLNGLCETQSKDKELCETQSNNFAKDKVESLRNTNFATHELATPKETIKETIKYNNNLDIEKRGNGDGKLTGGEYETLIAKFGKEKTDDLILELEDYKQSTGKPVIDEYQKILFLESHKEYTGSKKYSENDQQWNKPDREKKIARFTSGKYGHCVDT